MTPTDELLELPFLRAIDDTLKAYPKANVEQGFSIYGHDVRTGKERVEKWLKKLGYQGK
jgi:hypothetical protein